MFRTSITPLNKNSNQEAGLIFTETKLQYASVKPRRILPGEKLGEKLGENGFR